MKNNKGRKRYNKVKAKRVKAYTGFNPNIKIDLEALRQRYNVAIIPDIMDNNINIQRQKSELNLYLTDQLNNC